MRRLLKIFVDMYLPIDATVAMQCLIFRKEGMPVNVWDIYSSNGATTTTYKRCREL